MLGVSLSQPSARANVRKLVEGIEFKQAGVGRGGISVAISSSE
jgi:hypothetical protein